MKEEFRQEYDNIHAPEELKQKTKQLMQERLLLEEAAESGSDGSGKIGTVETGMGRKKHGSKKAAVIGIMTLMAAMLCIVIYAFSGGNGFYVTPMSEDNYYAEVEVKEGMIYFVERGESLELMPNASKAEAGQDKTTGEDGAEEDYSAVTKVGSDGSIRVKEGKGSLPKAKKEEYSCVAGEQFLVTVTKKEEPVYTAYLERDGILYTVIGERVSQKQFLDYVYKNFLKK